MSCPYLVLRSKEAVAEVMYAFVLALQRNKEANYHLMTMKYKKREL